MLSGYNEENNAVYFETKLTNDTVTTEITEYFSPYDVNRDKQVNRLDLTKALLYNTAKIGDDNWEFAKYADVNKDGRVDIVDFSSILNNIVW